MSEGKLVGISTSSTSEEGSLWVGGAPLSAIVVIPTEIHVRTVWLDGATLNPSMLLAARATTTAMTTVEADNFIFPENVSVCDRSNY